MAKFDAATAVDPMDFDLSKYGGPIGIIPEPTNGQIEAFFTTMQSAMVKIGAQPGQRLTLEAASAIPEDMATIMMGTMKQALVDLGGGSFSGEDIDRLPFRVQTAFVAWIVGELNPEAGAPGTRS